MRRTIAVVLTTVISWLLVAAPALATEGTTSSSDDVSWDGMILGGVVGIVIGTAIFIDSISGAARGDDAGDHH